MKVFNICYLRPFTVTPFDKLTDFYIIVSNTQVQTAAYKCVMTLHLLYQSSR